MREGASPAEGRPGGEAGAPGDARPSRPAERAGAGDTESSIRERARELGFSMVGIAGVEPTEHTGFYRDWIERGLHGRMAYLARDDSVRRRADLRRTMEDVRSAVVVAHEYHQEDDPEHVADPSRGIIARYARGADYHRVVGGKLRALARWIDGCVEGDVEARAYVDTGPILERDLARRAGLGWFGRNTMLIHPRRGSYFFLGILLLDIELEPDEPFQADHCGSCRACLDACPTDALLGRDADGAPVIDARRCISYLTIELRGPIPRELRPLVGNRVYGCDICQEVCPFNERFARETTEPRYAARGPGQRPVGVEALPGEAEADTDGAKVEMDGAEVEVDGAVVEVDGAELEVDGARSAADAGRRGHSSAGTRGDRGASDDGPGREDASAEAHPGTETPSLVELLATARDEKRWDAFSRGSAIRRAGRAGFARNVCVAMGNWLASVDEPPEEAVAALRAALKDEEALVREHAAWALERAAAL